LIWANAPFTSTGRTQGKSGAPQKKSRKLFIEFFAKFHAYTVVMDACAGSPHIPRKLTEIRHTVKLISPRLVKSTKNSFVDTEASCEAALRPTMRFAASNTESQQTLSVLHRMDESMVRERTRTVNVARSCKLIQQRS
jgi:transposase